MRILLITPYYKDSYSGNLSMGSAVKQAENLSKEHRIVVLTTGRKKKVEQVTSNLKIISVSGFLIPDPVNYCIAPLVFTEFVKLVREIKPDVVMVSKYMFFTSFLIPLARLMGIKVITTTDTFPGINWFPKSKLVGAVMWLYARLVGLPLLWMSNKVILLYSGLEPIAKKYHLDFVTIPNGVDKSYFKKQPLPKDLEKPVNEFWVGFVGRLESIKGYAVAVAAAKHFENRDKEVKFIFVGGNVKPCEEDNRIYLGYRKDVKNIYQFFDCLILPSHAEGLPNVLLEAMAQGVPCIASNKGGVSNIIDHNKNGLLIKSTNNLISSIKKLKSSKLLRERLSSSAKFTIEDRFAWEEIQSSYRNMLSSVVK